MANNDVDNFFVQPIGGATDNTLVIGGSMQTPTGTTLLNNTLDVSINDLSVNQSYFVSNLVTGIIEAFSTVINGALATGDAVITAKIGGAPIPGGAVTITQAGSAAGDVDGTIFFGGGNTFTAGQPIEFEVTGTNTAQIQVTISAQVKNT